MMPQLLARFKVLLLIDQGSPAYAKNPTTVSPVTHGREVILGIGPARKAKDPATGSISSLIP